MARQKIQSQVDYWLLGSILALLSFGLIMLYSVSTVESFEKFGNTTYFFYHQLLYGVLPGLVLLYIFSKIDYHHWQKLLPAILGASLLMLMLVKVPEVGWSIKGASRWIHVGPLLFQPAEFAKLALIIYLASWVEKKGKDINSFSYGLLPALCVIGLFCLLVLWQPDLGTMSVMVGISFVMLFVSGLNLRHFAWMAGSAALALLVLVKVEPYRMRRITTFFDPSIDPLGISYQINQAIMAIGSGGFWGYGYGLSRQKHNYLPEVLGDSVFAVIAEELGFLRVIAVIGLFVFFAVCGVRVARNAPDAFGKLIAMGIATWVTVQAFINIGAMLHLLPLTGIPLPFFSYGSSSLLVTMAGLGILLNVSRQAKVINR